MEKLKDQFLKEYDNFYSDLKELMKIPSVSSDLKNVEKALLYMVELAKGYGLEAKCVLDNRVAIIEYGSGEETMGLLAHLDVVPVNEAEWDYPCFDLSEDNGYLYGRGILDDKGPAMMMLYVLKILKDLNIEPKRKIQLILGGQEEVNWTDMEDYTKTFKLPDFGFTPDGKFPIQNAEKGLIDLKFTFDKKNIQEISAGNAANAVPDFLEIVIDNKKYNFNGVAAHSSLPELGENAIVKGMQEINKEHSHSFIEFILNWFQDYNGRDLGIYEENYVNDNVLNLTSILPTFIVDNEDTFDVIVNSRLALERIGDELITKFQNNENTYQYKFEVSDYLKPIYLEKDLWFIQKMKEVYEKETNTEVKFGLSFGTTYAKAIPNFVSFGPNFPEDESTAHQKNENLNEEKLIRAQNIYLKTIYELTK